MAKRDPIEDYEIIVEDLLEQVKEKSVELEKLIQTVKDDVKKSILDEADKRMKILKDFLESEKRQIRIYYEVGTVHVGEPSSFI